jgi:hypothetical protein
MTMRSISAATLLALAACGGGDKSPDRSAPEGAASTALATAAPAAAPAAGGPLGIVFDPATLNKGTKVGTVTADMLTPFPGVGLVLDRLGAVRRRAHADRPRHSPTSTPMCGRSASSPIRRARRSCPGGRETPAEPGFCFANQPEAQLSLAALREKRTATIVIDRYTINKAQSDQENTAELVRVVNRGEPIA